VSPPFLRIVTDEDAERARRAPAGRPARPASDAGLPLPMLYERWDDEPSLTAPDPDPLPADRRAPRPSPPSPRRLVALARVAGIAAAIAGLAWAGGQVRHVASDGWIAPVQLSPYSDAVAELRFAHHHAVAELGRLDAELGQLDADLASIDDSAAQLSRRLEARPAPGEPVALPLELAIERLHAEARTSRARRAASAARAATQRDLIAELEARPLYRAMSAAPHVAFVAYDELPDVAAGARVIDCAWSAFRCRDVGRVTEILPGEVTAQDPWGQPARGQYAVLALDEPTAIYARVLRLRR
jgi:hypothetical protein